MPDSSDPLPLEFFLNPRCPLAPIATKATATEAEQSKMTEKAKDLERNTPTKDFAGTSYVLPSLFFVVIDLV